MVAVFFILITSIAFITFIILRLLSSRVRVIRNQSRDNLRNKRGGGVGDTTTGLFCDCNEGTCEANI